MLNRDNTDSISNETPENFNSPMAEYHVSETLREFSASVERVLEHHKKECEFYLLNNLDGKHFILILMTAGKYVCTTHTIDISHEDFVREVQSNILFL